MKRNGMCPICYLAQVFKKPSKITNIYKESQYKNGIALTPPMGWSSWNTFHNHINQEMILETAYALKDKGLLDAGYEYLNLDDNWHSSMRDENGELIGDLTTFSNGIPSLVKKINELGFKVGIYSSNGTHTCEDLPASLYHEKQDAYTFAKWGIEYFKYDYCHNIPIPNYAPLVYGITIAKTGSSEGKHYDCTEAKLFGYAKFMRDGNLPNGKYVSGLDKNIGAMEYVIDIEEEGDYILTIDIKKKGQYEKALMALINGSDTYMYYIPSQKFWNITARFQLPVRFAHGKNTIRLFNPIGTRADSAMLQYQFMGKMLEEAARKVAAENNEPVKPIVYSICEWGKNEPYKWGATAGNLWRTTGDISPYWLRIMQIYEENVKLYKYAKIGAYNDPDMLEVGNGKLTYNENIAHFSLWCMMSAPLILGNDIRDMGQNIIDIVTNKSLIAIDQDRLCKQAKRIIKGEVDYLIKPLTDEAIALCVFNKSIQTKWFNIKIEDIIADDYAGLKRSKKYKAVELWTEAESIIDTSICGNLESHSVKVFKITNEME